ncbi:hypothetical protein F2Q68_00003595 [Brassica cretica]|uniref:Uncharacterized protein n=1 Tax=Brassica cretica TaxID=69181 RepID=A0A8S9JGK8_BRACR|nr:hypothetical protein F2Q68_00003595 [Brassica cretica]
MLSLLRRKKAKGLSVSFSTSPSSRLNLVVSLVLILGVSLESRRLSRISSSLSSRISSSLSNLVSISLSVSTEFAFHSLRKPLSVRKRIHYDHKHPWFIIKRKSEVIDISFSCIEVNDISLVVVLVLSVHIDCH